MTARYLDADQDARVAEQYLAGRSLADLSRELGFSVKAVRNSLIRTGTQCRPVGQPVAEIPVEVRHAVLQFNDLGASVTDIMRWTDLGRKQVHRVLRAHGIEPKNASIGARSTRWKGGRFKDESGYWRVWVEVDHPFASVANASGYAMEHRLVMSEQLGRAVEKGETVHHINGDRGDNRPENLQLRSGRHGAGVALRCRACGSHDVEAVKLDD